MPAERLYTLCRTYFEALQTLLQLQTNRSVQNAERSSAELGHTVAGVASRARSLLRALQSRYICSAALL